MSRRHLPIAVVLSAILSGAAYWLLSQPADELAPRRIVRVAVSKSGRWIAAGAASGWIGIIDQTQPEGPQRFRGGPGPLRDLRFTRDEKWLVITNDSASRHLVQSLSSLEPLLAGEDPGDPQKEAWDSSQSNPAERTSNLASAPDDTVVFGNYAGSIEVHSAATGKLLRRFTFR